MSHLFTALFIAMLLPFLAKLPLIKAMNNEKGGYDNNNPRAQQRALKGFGERANAAHYNSFEALAIFAPAVLAVAVLGQVDTTAIALAYTFVVARVVFLICYWTDKATLRSLVWAVSMIAAFVMMGRAIW
ncbi:MAPEG family protein [Aliidiomarina celeris]|uniref:MAPEG family protein n=1 Tax=Aliidiomarina celeris TaxID=2249428 RepID=UPI000DEBEF20|nr:MAPEG family protein [Aliidiomarina celeris]